MNSETTIRDIMTLELLSLTPEMNIDSAVRALLDQHLSGAPVLDNAGVLVGVLSKKDCLRAALAAHYQQLWGGIVGDYMSTDIKSLDPDLDIVRAASVFLDSPYRRFPVLEQNRLIGQVSRCDVLEALSRQWH